MVVALGFDETAYFMALLALVVALATKACLASDVVSISPPGTPRSPGHPLQFHLRAAAVQEHPLRARANTT